MPRIGIPYTSPTMPPSSTAAETDPERRRSTTRSRPAQRILRLLMLAVVLAVIATWPEASEQPSGPIVQTDLLATQQCRPEGDRRTIACDFRTARESRLRLTGVSVPAQDLMAEAELENGDREPLTVEASLSADVIDLERYDHRQLRTLIYTKSGAPLSLSGIELRGVTENVNGPLAYLEPGIPARPNILLYVVDTLRADRMSLYGYKRETTPNLDSFGKKSVVFDHAYSNGADTRAGIPALLASGTPNQLRGHMTKLDGQPSASIAELIKRRVYRTGGFQANMTMLRSLGFARGFDTYEILRTTVDDEPVKTPANVLHERALEWITADPRFPFFAYIQTMDVHNPYDAPPPFRDRYYEGPTERPLPDTSGMEPDAAQRILDTYVTLEPDKYDECVAYADHEIGNLLAELERLGYMSNTVIIITSDHGESLGAGARFPHGTSLDEEIVRIPLLIYLPWAPAKHRRVKEVVSLVDLAPTIADLIGLSPPPDFAGRSLFRPRTKYRPSYALGERNIAEQSVEWFIREGPWKLRIEGDSTKLSYITKDPTASKDVSDQFPNITRYLARRIGALDEGSGDESRPGKDGLGLDEEQLREVGEAMRLLGYE